MSGPKGALLGGALLLAGLLGIPFAVAGSDGDSPATTGALAIPPRVLAAYQSAAARCPGLRWQLLAGVGYIESGHGTTGGATVDANTGEVTPSIFGPPLDGTGGSASTPIGQWIGWWGLRGPWLQAVGPMQFLPATFMAHAVDADGDGILNPHDIDDATATAAAYLCAAGGGAIKNEHDVVYAYNHSVAYVAKVLDYADRLTYEATGGPLLPGTYALPLAPSVFDEHPEYLVAPHHDYPAIDIPVPIGTPVFAVTAGAIVAVTADASCGYGLVLRGDDGWDYVYCHGSTVVVGVGAEVGPGDLIMWSGNTGNSTGPHLHFGVQTPDGHRLCPQPLLTDWYHGKPSTPASVTDAGCTY